MDVLLNLWHQLLNFYRHFPLLTLGVVAILLVWIYFKPKQAFKGLLFLLFVAAVFYVVSLMRDGTGSSISIKERMMHKTEKALGE